MLPSPTWPKGSGRQPGMSLIDRGVRLLDEGRDGGDRHRDVVLDRGADVALHLAEQFADAPERLAPVRGCRRWSRRAPGPCRGLRRGCPSIASRRPLARCEDKLDQHVPIVGLGQRIAALGVVLDHRLDAGARHQLERGDAAGGALGGDAQQIDRGLRRGHGGIGGLDRARARHQPQHRRRDDAERAFGADEQVLEIVAGIVLLELVEIVAARGRRRARPRARARASARCRARSRRCRRHWSRDCRRWCRCLPTAEAADRAGRRRPPLRARAAA